MIEAIWLLFPAGYALLFLIMYLTERHESRYWKTQALRYREMWDVQVWKRNRDDKEELA